MKMNTFCNNIDRHEQCWSFPDKWDTEKKTKTHFFFFESTERDIVEATILSFDREYGDRLTKEWKNGFRNNKPWKFPTYTFSCSGVKKKKRINLFLVFYQNKKIWNWKINRLFPFVFIPKKKKNRIGWKRWFSFWIKKGQELCKKRIPKSNKRKCHFTIGLDTFFSFMETWRRSVIFLCYNEYIIYFYKSTVVWHSLPLLKLHGFSIRFS